jgi:hypothetical protein
MNNAWHRIAVTVPGDPGTRTSTARPGSGFELGEAI